MLSTDLSEERPVQVKALELSRSFNLRDLGGLSTRTGQAVVPGRLYRSGDPSQLGLPTADGLACAIGFRTVIDLRMSIELKEHGTGLHLLSCRRLHHPLFEIALPHWVDPSDGSPQATATRYLEMLCEGAGMLVQIVRALGERDALPAIIHCAAGRDRTGIVIACVLDLLGVADETIASDYALSDLAANDTGRAHSETILHFLSLLRRQHGSTFELLTKHGMSADDQEQLLRSLLTG